MTAGALRDGKSLLTRGGLASIGSPGLAGMRLAAAEINADGGLLTRERGDGRVHATVPERPTRVLLEARPAVGKTTVARRLGALLREAGVPLAGVVTEEIRHGGRRVGFALETFDDARAVLAHVELPGPPRSGNSASTSRPSERLALPALSSWSEGGVVLIDEPGRMELASDGFRNAVSDLLESPVALVATVHVVRNPFTEALKRRPGIELVRVTAHNRDELPARLAARLGSGADR